VITRFDGILIEDDSHLINVVGLTSVGEKVEIELTRGGEPTVVSVTVGARQD